MREKISPFWWIIVCEFGSSELVMPLKNVHFNTHFNFCCIGHCRTQTAEIVSQRVSHKLWMNDTALSPTTSLQATFVGCDGRHIVEKARNNLIFSATRWKMGRLVWFVFAAVTRHVSNLLFKWKEMASAFHGSYGTNYGRIPLKL